MFCPMCTKKLRFAWKTVAILLEMAFGTKWASFRLFKDPIIEEEIVIPSDKGDIRADLYRPRARGRRPAVILGHGMLEAGKDDPRLRRVGDILARAGFVVLVPELDGLKRIRIDPGDVRVLVAGVEYLHRQAFVRPGSIALAGFCISASLAVVAAEDPAISDKVALVSSWGGYYDTLNLIESVATRSYEYSGGRHRWEPAPNVGPVVAENLIGMVRSRKEREYLTQALASMGNDAEIEGAGRPERMSRLGGALHQWLSSGLESNGYGILPALSPRARRDLSGVSPATNIERLKARAFIIHGEADGTVPSVESLRLAEAITGRGQVYYKTFRFFDHVNPNMSSITPASLPKIAGDVFGFYFYMYGIISHLER